MNIEGQELGPYEPVPDVLVLAAIERAIRHGSDPAWIVNVGIHLGYQRTPHSTRKLRLQLDRLLVQRGWVDRKGRHGREHWWLTTAGERHLKQAREEGLVGALPESPQHRSWRKARAAAAERIAGFRILLSSVIEEVGVAEAAAFTSSETWFVLGQRLAAATWLLGSATYCLDEWAEPGDERADTKPDSYLTASPRAVSMWDRQEANAKGE